MVNDIENHPNYAGFLLPHDVKKTIIKYKYTFILRCVSYDDSLNFRPVYYAYLKILPFLDPAYDPDCLQIPWEIQEKLLVKDSEDIAKKIEYFNKHDEERIQILEKLRTHFEIETFEKDWTTQIKNYFE